MTNYRWTYDDDIVTYYLYRYGKDSLLFDINGIVKILGMKQSSMLVRIENFRYIETGKGLSNFAQLSEKVFHDYKNISQADHYNKIRKILNF